MFPDAGPADKDSVGVIRHGVGSKQIGHVVPHEFVNVVAVGSLELLNGAYVLAARYFGFELIQPLLQSRYCGSNPGCREHDSDKQTPHLQTHVQTRNSVSSGFTGPGEAWRP